METPRVIVPSREFRALLHARRDHPLAPPKRIDVGRTFVAVKDAWWRLRAHWEPGWARREDSMVGLERAADAQLTASATPEAIDLEAVAVAERMLNMQGTLVPLVAARAGAAAALRMKLRSQTWNVTRAPRQNPSAWMLVPAGPPWATLDAGWKALRDVVCAADDATYAEALAIARDARAAETDASRRVRIDFVFPGEPAWADADVRAALQAPNLPSTAHIVIPGLASMGDESVVVELIEKCAPHQIAWTAPYACDVVLALGADRGTRALARLAEKVLGAHQRNFGQLDQLATAMKSIHTEAMASELARWVRHPRFGPCIVPYFAQNDALARAALAPMAGEKSIAADAARRILGGNARASEPDEGTLDDAPRILREPPWTTRPPRRGPALERLPYVESIEWAEGERERLAAEPPIRAPNATVRDIDQAELAEWDRLPEGQKYVDVWPRWEQKRWTLLELPDDRRLALWDAGKARLYHSRSPSFMLARFGERALDGLFARNPFHEYDERIIDACLRVDSPRAALVCAKVLARRRLQRKRARAWLVAHAEAASIALVPIVIGPEARERAAAERALRIVAAERPDVLSGVAARYGDEARAAIDAHFLGDPIARIERRGGSPKWLRLDSLPLLRARNGRPLPRSAAAALVEILRARSADVPYAGIDVLREALDPDAAAEFAWALFMVWILHGRPRTQSWTAHALADFPRDDTPMRLAPYARELAQADPRACTVLADVLATIGTDPATMVLLEIDEAARHPMLRDVVGELLGPKRDEPIDLGREGSVDLGGRTVRVELDELLVPRIVLPDGRRVAQMPRASKTDDPARVAAATAAFNRLRRGARLVARRDIRRLEHAMIASRRFSAAELERRFVRHPLLAHVARRVVWGVFSGPALVATFRLTEDGCYADEEDSPFSLDEGAEVGVVHPLDLDDRARERWSALFGDYEIVQPFEQLGRIVFAGSTAEATALLATTKDVIVPARSLLKTLDAHGWQRSTERRWSHAFRDLRSVLPVRANIAFTPGIDIDKLRSSPPQKLGPILFNGSGKLDGVDRIDLSELVRTVLTLRG